MTRSKVKCLLFGCVPHGQNFLRVEDEHRDIILDAEDTIDFVSMLRVTTKDFRDAIATHHPEIIHFSGHGLDGNSLAFQKPGSGEPLSVSAEELADTIKANSRYPRIVVLSACASEGLAGVLLRKLKDLKFVIGTTAEINDEQARLYSRAFYRLLSQNRTLENAHKSGAVDAKEADLGRFVVVGRKRDKGETTRVGDFRARRSVIVRLQPAETAATVRIDDGPPLTAPFKDVVVLGEHAVAASLEGYLPASTTVVVEPVQGDADDLAQEIPLELKRRTTRWASITVTPEDAPAQLSIDGVLHHPPWSGELPFGQRRLQVLAPGFKPFARDVPVVPRGEGEPDELNIDLELEPLPLPPPPPPPPPPTPTWLLLLLTAAFIAGAVGLQVNSPCHLSWIAGILMVCGVATLGVLLGGKFSGGGSFSQAPVKFKVAGPAAALLLATPLVAVFYPRESSAACGPCSLAQDELDLRADNLKRGDRVDGFMLAGGEGASFSAAKAGVEITHSKADRTEAKHLWKTQGQCSSLRMPAPVTRSQCSLTQEEIEQRVADLKAGKQVDGVSVEAEAVQVDVSFVKTAAGLEVRVTRNSTSSLRGTWKLDGDCPDVSPPSGFSVPAKASPCSITQEELDDRARRLRAGEKVEETQVLAETSTLTVSFSLSTNAIEVKVTKQQQVQRTKSWAFSGDCSRLRMPPAIEIPPLPPCSSMTAKLFEKVGAQKAWRRQPCDECTAVGTQPEAVFRAAGIQCVGTGKPTAWTVNQ